MSDVISTSLRILVVDDNEDVANTTSRLLRFSGHEIWVAHDGKAAVEAAKSFHPDLVLMDIGMPVLNGFEAARLVRRALGQSMTLVAVTAYSSDADRAEARAAGFNYYLVKPAQFSDLLTIISEVAGHRR